MEGKQWYSNKDLLEMLNDLKKDIVDLRVEMKETKTLIRDYNNLRENVNKVNKKIVELEKMIITSVDNRKEYIGYIIAAISILFLILNYVT